MRRIALPQRIRSESDDHSNQHVVSHSNVIKRRAPDPFNSSAAPSGMLEPFGGLHDNLHLRAPPVTFKIAEAPTFGRTYRSVFFYAVILRSSPATNEGDECGQIPESVRLRTQRLFPGRKVFASHFGCAEELVLYSNINQSFNFIAVYAGKTRAQANSMLARVRATRRFPRANIRRMQVLLEFST